MEDNGCREQWCLKTDNGTGNPDTQLSGLVEFKT